MLLLEQVVEIEQQTLAEDHSDRLSTQHVLTIAYQANAQVRDAVSGKQGYYRHRVAHTQFLCVVLNF